MPRYPPPTDTASVMRRHIGPRMPPATYPQIMPLSAALLLAGALIAVALVAGFTWRALDGRRRRGGGHPVDPHDLDNGALGPVSTLVLFSTETCARCPQVRRMLRQVAQDRSGVEQADIDLTHRAELAQRHGILQTPTTFITDPDGVVLARFAGVPRRSDIEAALSPSPILEIR